MKRNARTAFNRLTKLGFVCYDPVKDRASWGNGFFDISAEEGNPDADYWMNPDMDRLSELLEPHGLHPEWVNPGVITVYEA